MAEYEFNGPMPMADPAGELVHPGDVREFDGEPDWGGPWRPVERPVETGAGAPEPKPAPPSESLTTLLPPAAPAKDM